MKYAFILIAFILSLPAFAIKTCETTVVPLAFAMAKANGQSNLINKHFIDVAADYSYIVVTLGNYNGQKEGRFLMTMGEDYQRVRKCVVTKVEAL